MILGLVLNNLLHELIAEIFISKSNQFFKLKSRKNSRNFEKTG
jgi:hypothetical protein